MGKEYKWAINNTEKEKNEKQYKYKCKKIIKFTSNERKTN